MTPSFLAKKSSAQTGVRIIQRLVTFPFDFNCDEKPPPARSYWTGNWITVPLPCCLTTVPSFCNSANAFTIVTRDTANS